MQEKEVLGKLEIECRDRKYFYHVTDHVTDHVRLLLSVFEGEMDRQQLMDALKLNHRVNFMNNYIKPALEAEVIEMTIPDKPRSVNQKYRLTSKGKALKQERVK